MIVNHRTGFLYRVYDGVHRHRQPIPFGEFLLELFPTRLSQRIEFRLPSGIGFGPIGPDPTVLLKPMQSRIEGALLHLQGFTGNLLDSFANRPTVFRFDGDGLQNEKSEGPLNEIVWLAHAMTIYNTLAIVDSQGVNGSSVLLNRLWLGRFR